MPPTGPILFYPSRRLGRPVWPPSPRSGWSASASPGRAAVLAAAGAPARLAVRAGLGRRDPVDRRPALAGLFVGRRRAAPSRPASGVAPGFALGLVSSRSRRPNSGPSAARLFGEGGADHRLRVRPPACPSVAIFSSARPRPSAASRRPLPPSSRLVPPARSRPPAVLPSGPAVRRPPSRAAAAFRKNWPLERFLAAAAHPRRPRPGRLLRHRSGRGRGSGRADLRARLPDGWRLLHEPPLADLAGLLARCGVYLGNDSGVTHLAAAAGAPVLALFRDENLPAWRPAAGRRSCRLPSRPGSPRTDVRAALARFPAPSALQYRP